MKGAEISLGRDFARALDPVLLARDCILTLTRYKLAC